MGIDGFSMGNLLPNTDMTAAQMAGEAEILAQKEAKLEVKTMDKSSKEGGVNRKKDDKDGNSQESFDEEEHEDNESQENDFTNKHLSVEDFEQSDVKDFSIRINDYTNEVELLNKKDKRVMETIDADNLMRVVAKLDHASGIFVNKKI